MLDPLAAFQPRQNVRLLVLPTRRYQKHDRLADRFLRSVAEQALRALIPALNDAIEVLADDGVIGGIYDRGQPGRRGLGALARSDVLEVHRKTGCANRSYFVEEPLLRGRLEQLELDAPSAVHRLAEFKFETVPRE